MRIANWLYSKHRGELTLNCYKCLLQIHYEPWYQPQKLYLSKKPLQWVDFFTSYVYVPEDYHTFLSETQKRVLPRKKTEIEKQFEVKFPKNIKKIRWKIYKHNNNTIEILNKV